MEDTKTSYFCHWNSPLGGITMASDGTYLTGLWFDGQKHFGSTLSPDSSETVLNIFHTTILWLEKYFQGECPPESVPIRMIGTDYQKSVWRALLEIPFGSTELVGCISNGYYGSREIMSRHVYDDRIRVEFEGNSFWAPSGYDTYLKSLYGDYMKLPPEDKRVPHHQFKAYFAE